ncbi:Aste57867_20814 [Aphanomyces stellatus]|uniref:Aste57867_20814 protein n=1 Tax=Aphanomyces stellatus TaxID=120398 RepID=A0A485LHY2_9STRA|nr:hypothetical protein As57867_020746 [Aphanomyces stellatus]VFT97493.1 Aste57867_20814 [Aphanomyces stellatus]
MAWCSRTSRSRGGTNHSNPSLGPGCYNPDAATQHKIKPSFAAFGSSGVKDAYPDINLNTPGPGAYQSTGHPAAVSGVAAYADHKSSMFKSTSGRTNFKAEGATPGPGAYANTTAFAQKKKKTMRRSKSDPPPSSTGKVKWVRVPTAPSIPNVAQSFGYEEGPKGQMILQQPIHTGHTGCTNDVSGPGEYEALKALQHLSCSRATNFSKSRTTRDDPSVGHAAALPGPGFYQTDIVPIANQMAKPSAVFKSNLTRERAANPISQTTPVPGPGSYRNPVGFKPAKKPEHLQFFGSTSSRFDAEKAVLQPTPTYTPERQTIFKPKPHHNVGFCSTNKRFDTTMLAKEEFDIGPGSYEAQGLVQELQQRVKGRAGVFGSTSKRFEAPRTQSILETVLEQEQSPPRQTNQEEAPKLKSSVFASATDRFRDSKKDHAPCPGDYEVSMTWDKPGGKAVFASHLDRNSYMDKNSIPGPGSYAAPDSLKKSKPSTQRKDVFVSVEPRFKNRLAPLANLGPGAYNPDTIETDWNRPTYNITIATEMEKRI